MAEDEPIAVDPLALPTADKLAGTYGDMPVGTKGGEGNYFQAALTLDPDSGDQVAIFTHKTCFVPSGKDVPFSGMWLDESHVFTGTWEVTAEEKTDAAVVEGKEEGKEETSAPVLVAVEEVNSAWAEQDPEESGVALGTDKIVALEEKFGLPPTISSELGAEGALSLTEFVGQLQTNGNIAPPPSPPNAVFTVKSSTKKMQVIEDGTFTEAEQPYSKYTWTFRMSAPEYNSLELVDSNYPVSLSRERFVKSDTIEMKYCKLSLAKK